MDQTRRRSAPSVSATAPTARSRGTAAKRPAAAPSSSNGGSSRPSSAAADAAALAGARRKVYVLVSLVAVMSLTGGLLVLMKPDPVAPDASFSLMATEPPDRAFATRTPVRPGAWKYVFVHHSNAPSGSAATIADAGGELPDHFVIGNGDGLGDGEIQVGARWDRQQPAGRTPDVNRMDPACVSICLVGDFDRSPPTVAQMQRLTQLVTMLQARLRIGPENVWLADAADSPAGVGRHFPVAAFRRQLRP